MRQIMQLLLRLLRRRRCIFLLITQSANKNAVKVNMAHKKGIYLRMRFSALFKSVMQAKVVCVWVIFSAKSLFYP